MQGKKGFTLVEILVVVFIIVLVAGISMPVISGFTRQQRLRGAGQLIQNICIEAKARSIAEGEDQYVIFFAKDEKYNTSNIWKEGGTPDSNEVDGKVNTFQSYDSNLSNSTSDDDYRLVSVVSMPEFTRFADPTDDTKTPENFCLIFHPDGTIEFGPNITDKSNDPETSNDTDIVIIQTNRPGLKCFVDVIANTGRVRYLVREP